MATKTIGVNARLRAGDINFGDRSLKIFPIGYLDNSKSTSKGSFTDPSVALVDKRNNVLYEPNKSENKSRVGHTIRSANRAVPIETRKVGEYRHTFSYTYNNIYNGEYRLIKRFVKDIADFESKSFHLVDFSSGVKVTALATTAVATYNASIYNTQCFTTASARGGNFVCIRDGRTKLLRIGRVTTVNIGQSIDFQASPGYGNLTTLVSGDGYAYPIYKVFMAQQGLEFRVYGFVDNTQNASIAGPVRSGEVAFRQRGTK